jgi:hypothetical protein
MGWQILLPKSTKNKELLYYGFYFSKKYYFTSKKEKPYPLKARLSPRSEVKEPRTGQK